MTQVLNGSSVWFTPKSFPIRFVTRHYGFSLNSHMEEQVSVYNQSLADTGFVCTDWHL